MPAEKLDIRDSEGLTLRVSKRSPTMISMLTSKLISIGVVDKNIYKNLDFISMKRGESRFGIGLNIRGEKLFYLFKDSGLIDLAETPKEILEIGRKGRRLVNKKLNLK